MPTRLWHNVFTLEFNRSNTEKEQLTNVKNAEDSGFRGQPARKIIQ